MNTLPSVKFPPFLCNVDDVVYVNGKPHCGQSADAPAGLVTRVAGGLVARMVVNYEGTLDRGSIWALKVGPFDGSSCCCVFCSETSPASEPCSNPFCSSFFGQPLVAVCPECDAPGWYGEICGCIEPNTDGVWMFSESFHKPLDPEGNSIEEQTRSIYHLNGNQFSSIRIADDHFEGVNVTGVNSVTRISKRNVWAMKKTVFTKYNDMFCFCVYCNKSSQPNVPCVDNFCPSYVGKRAIGMCLCGSGGFVGSCCDSCASEDCIYTAYPFKKE